MQLSRAAKVKGACVLEVFQEASLGGSGIGERDQEDRQEGITEKDAYA